MRTSVGLPPPCPSDDPRGGRVEDLTGSWGDLATDSKPELPPPELVVMVYGFEGLWELYSKLRDVLTAV